MNLNKEEKNTYEVEKLLEKMKPEQLPAFYMDNSRSLIDSEKAFYYYMKDVVEAKRLFFKDIYIGAGVSESYGEKIIRMEKHTKNRDLILKLCIAAHFTVIEMDKALKLYGMNTLYAKNPRDACIMVAVHNRIYDFYQIDEMLEEQGFQRLTSIR